MHWASILLTGVLVAARAVQSLEQHVEQAPLLDVHDGVTEAAGSSVDDESIDLSSPLFKLHRELVEIESITPNEFDAGQYLIDFFRKHNFAVEAQPIESNLAGDDDTKRKPRYNIFTYPKSRNVSVILSSHIDTVPPFYPYKVTHAPHHKHRNVTLHGRGSVDDKASVAAQTIAVLELLSHTQISPEDVGLLFVVGEETGGVGMRGAEGLGIKPKAVIFGEPTDNRLAAGHKGLLGSKLHAHGRAAHSGYPWLGVSANELLVTALSALMASNDKFPHNDKYGRTTLNIGKIEGGVASNVVPENASAAVSLRLAGGPTEDVKATLKQIVADAIKPILEDAKKRGIDVDGIGINVTWVPAIYPPQDCSTDVEGFDDPITVNYGTDVPNWRGTGERYLYGPGTILVAHSDHEALAATDLIRAVEDYKKMVLSILKKLKAKEDAQS